MKQISVTVFKDLFIKTQKLIKKMVANGKDYNFRKIFFCFQLQKDFVELPKIQFHVHS